MASSDQTVYDIFISYARKDDRPNLDGPQEAGAAEHNGWVTALHDQILADHRRFTTEPLRIFLDVSPIEEMGIQAMDDWRHRILGALRSSKILLVCLSPNYFESEVCRWEWEEYMRRRTQHQMGADSVATVYFVEIPDGEEEGSTERLNQLLRGNFTDVRPWFPQGPKALKDAEVQRRLDRLGISLWERLERGRRARLVPGNVRRPNPFFVGRNRELQRLHEQVGTGAIGLVTAVHGLGGMGKTELAYHYANAWADWYPLGIWSLSAERHTQLVPLIGELAHIPQFEYQPGQHAVSSVEAANTKANAETVGRSVLYQLEQRARKLDRDEPNRSASALVILDNVSDAALLSKQQLTELPNGANWLRLIATTRLDPKSFAMSTTQIETVSVDALGEEDALALLRDHQPGQQFQSVKEEQAARKIVRELGGFTLAVEQVAVHLGLYADSSTPTEYLQRLRDAGLPSSDELAKDSDVAAQILHREKQLGPILTTTIERLAESSPAILTVLQCAAFMPPDSIPWELLWELAKHEHAELADKIAWARIRRRLEGTRLIVSSDMATRGRIHRVVAAHVRSSMTDARRCEIASLVLPSFAFSLYGTKFERRFDRSDPDCIRIWSRMEEQVIELLSSFPDDHCSELLAWMSNDLGTFLNITKRFELGRDMLRRSVRWTENAGLSASHLANRYSNLATAEEHCGNREAHLECILKAVDLDRQSGDDYALAMSLTNLVEYYRVVSDLDCAWNTAMEAREAFQRSRSVASWKPGLLESTIAELEQLKGDVDDAWCTARGALEYFEVGEHFVDDYSRSLRIAARIGLQLDKLSPAAGYCARAIANDAPRIEALGISWGRSCQLLAQIATKFDIDQDKVREMLKAMEIAAPHFSQPLDFDEENFHVLSAVKTAADSLTFLLADMCTNHAEKLEPNNLESLARSAMAVDLKFFGPESQKYASDLCNLSGILLNENSLEAARDAALQAIEIDKLHQDDPDYVVERAKTHSMMGGIYLHLGENDAAVRHFELASQLDPDSFPAAPSNDDVFIFDKAGQGIDIVFSGNHQMSSPTFSGFHENIFEPSTADSAGCQSQKTGRNDPCPCGSDKKFKDCCLPKLKRRQ